VAVATVTSPIGLQSWNHSFAKIGRIAGVSARPLPDEEPTVLYFFGLPIHEQLQVCKGMLPIGTPCKPMLPNLNCWGLPAKQTCGAGGEFTANLCFQPCKPLGEVTATTAETRLIRRRRPGDRPPCSPN
jgi:hypothetical protein